MIKSSDEELEKEYRAWARFLYKQYRKELSEIVKRGIKASREAKNNENNRDTNSAN